jgi:L-threonylcarbamoyladenylate synthase
MDLGIKELMMEPTVDQALDWIQSGFIVVAPLEHGYVYLTDAFSHDAVRSLHVLRNDGQGVAAQVLVDTIETAAGIVREISPEVTALMRAYWPGLLSLNLHPQHGLNWDLGDDKELDIVSVRVPSADFVRRLLAKSGPLACASATVAGAPPLLRTSELTTSQNELVRVCDLGELSAGPRSSVVSVSETGITLLREDAISFEELNTHAPGISRSSSANT